MHSYDNSKQPTPCSPQNQHLSLWEWALNKLPLASKPTAMWQPSVTAAHSKR